MNSSTALARAVVDQLIESGVRDFVLSPGSRSAPVALLLAQRERDGQVRLHVRIDERSAAYLGLGIARIGGDPVAVVCTSGTAVANYAPAVVEASYAGIPLVVVSCDRPPEMRNTGSNQTIDQVGLFGTMMRRSVDVVAERDRADQGDQWRFQVARCVWAAVGMDPASARGRSLAGPVQINIGFREPLVPADGDPRTGQSRRDGPPPPTKVVAVREPVDYLLGDIGIFTVPARTVLVAGDIVDPADSVAVMRLARSCGWPIVAEPSGNALCADAAVAASALLLRDGSWLEQHRPELVITVGRFGLDRSTMALVRSAETHLAVGLSGKDRPDPLHSAAAVLSAVPLPPS
ncbi:MAG: 2-succinyl-5-enolpyruvyl-6-hydroxy-3-cyclohexene-1-carboxylic-acid synthase, partial [Actinomycetes bacterium]